MVTLNILRLACHTATIQHAGNIQGNTVIALQTTKLMLQSVALKSKTVSCDF